MLITNDKIILLRFFNGKTDMLNLCYEKLKPEHLPYFYEIRFSVTENLVHPHQIQYLLREQALDDINQGGGWICKYGSEYVGVAFGVFIPEALVGGLFVKPEFQSRGIGTTLLTLVTNWFFDMGAQTILLTTDRDSKAERFYKRNGWVEHGLDTFGQIELVKNFRSEK